MWYFKFPMSMLRVQAADEGRSGIATQPATCLRGGVSTTTTTGVKAEIAALLARKDAGALKRALDRWLPADLAPLIADLSVEELAALFRVSSREVATATFTYMPVPAQRKLLRALSQPQAAAL